MASDFIESVWKNYFDGRVLIDCADRNVSFNVYYAGNQGPVLYCIHGGGYSGLTWAMLAAQLKHTCRIVAPDLRGHGLTYSNDDMDLSIQTLAADVSSIYNTLFNEEAFLKSVLSDRNEEDALSQQNKHNEMKQDRKCSRQAAEQLLSKGYLGKPSSTCCIGHSMGASVVVHAMDSMDMSCVHGAILIDVVEGTALASLPYMQQVLHQRPASFSSLEAAVEWYLRSGMGKNRESASVSMPGMLVQPSINSGKTEKRAKGNNCSDADPIQDKGHLSKGNTDTNARSTSIGGTDSQRTQIDGKLANFPPRHRPINGGLPPIQEHRVGKSTLSRETDTDLDPQRQQFSNHGINSNKSSLTKHGESRESLKWRTPLIESAKYWEGWYKGLSKAFVGLRVPKMLILAGTDRLDKELTIAQMQGKFQLLLLPNSGHAIQEDTPEKLSDAILTFIKRFSIQ